MDDIDLNIKLIYLQSENTLKLLSKNIKKDNGFYEGCNLPKKLNSNEKIVCIVDKTNQNIISFIWFGTYKNVINLDLVDETNYVHINYSYTFRGYRNIGLNKKLRLWIESECKKNNIKYIVSVPLFDSNSRYVLEKLEYIKINSYYLKKII